MSRYIGKRVSYECGFCKKQFTLNKQSIDDSEKSGEVFCSKQCSEQFYLLGVRGRHLWLDPDDLKFARALQEENRLEAVKWLCEKARPHTLTPLKDAKEILDAYR